MITPARWQIDLQGRSLRLLDKACERFALPLDAGGKYRLVVQEIADLRDIMRAFDLAAGVTVLPANGGLLGAATVAENFALALHALREANRHMTQEWEELLHLALRQCGMTEARIAHIGRMQPMHLSRPERLLLGMVRHILRPPEVLVLDNVFSALTRREALALIELEAVFHDYHPFRPAIFVDLDSHGLPEIPDCRRVIRLEDAACPC